ncbi:MAG: GFA family protein [Gammaproteobacteria bacterium]|nr:GFA family protein [Gammaproteobacteria bacterium]
MADETNDDKPFAAGSCSCGNISLVIRKKPQLMLQCHCLDCQKSTGAGHTSNAYFATEDVTIHGDAACHSLESETGYEMIRCFCPTCGARMYGYNGQKPGTISIPVGCLDDHSWFSPQVVLYASRREDWDITSDEVPTFDKGPPT